MICSCLYFSALKLVIQTVKEWHHGCCCKFVWPKKPQHSRCQRWVGVSLHIEWLLSSAGRCFPRVQGFPGGDLQRGSLLKSHQGFANQCTGLLNVFSLATDVIFQAAVVSVPNKQHVHVHTSTLSCPQEADFQCLSSFVPCRAEWLQKATLVKQKGAPGEN